MTRSAFRALDERIRKYRGSLLRSLGFHSESSNSSSLSITPMTSLSSCFVCIFRDMNAIEEGFWQHSYDSSSLGQHLRRVDRVLPLGGPRLRRQSQITSPAAATCFASFARTLLRSESCMTYSVVAEARCTRTMQLWGGCCWEVGELLAKHLNGKEKVYCNIQLRQIKEAKKPRYAKHCLNRLWMHR